MSDSRCRGNLFRRVNLLQPGDVANVDFLGNSQLTFAVLLFP